jgi:oligopeptide transport system substrate-binding protein
MPVTASDFAFSYERLLTPELGAQYAEMLYFLKGAEEFNKGKTKDFSTVGVQVIDDLTLQLTLRGPTPYFREILKHYTWTAVPRHVVLRHGSIGQRGNPWTRKENIVCNGPYQLKSWRRTDHIEVERNPFYWNAANVTLNGIRFLPITNLYTEARMFRDGQLHMTYAATSEVIDMMKATNPSALRQEPYVGTGFFRFNTTRKPLNDVRVRKALSLAIDRPAICNTVFRGYTPAYAMTPPMGDYKPPHLLEFDRVLAKRVLDDAGYPGGKGFPRLKVLIASKETAATLAQAVQAMWRDTLGIEVEIENKEWNAYLVAMQELDYDIANAGWVGDYLDPLTFLEMWTPGNGNNLTGWKSPEFVKLLQQSFQENDPTRRLENLYQAETILVDEAPIALIAWQARNYLIHPSLEGWHPLLLSNNPYQFLRLVPER